MRGDFLGAPLPRKESLIGAKLGPYEVVRFIGQGGTAAVFEARHSLLGKRVALKLLHEHLADDPELAGRFLREGRVASQLRHPNALEIVDVGEHSGMAYLVVELLEGGTLHDRLTAKRILELDDALAIVLPIAAALAHAHAHGVIHRDIKPANVFLARGADGVTVPKLIDFGLSKSVDAKDAGPLTATGVVMGTVAYMAPEQTMGMKLTTARSDQYALAAILYECVTGRPPFSAAGFYELLEVVRSGVAPPPSLVNAHLESEIDGPIMRALHRDPAKRFADVRAFAAALLPFASAGVADLWRRELGPRTAAASSANIRAARSPWFDRVLRGDSGRPPPMAPREERDDSETSLRASGERPAAATGLQPVVRPVAPRRTAGSKEEETIARFPTEGSVPLRRVRSTLICSGIVELRERGVFDAYAAKLDDEARDVLVHTIAGVWLSVDIAVKHYAAVDSLGLTAEDAFQIGAAAGKRIQESALQTLVRLASGAGATPWTVFQVYESLWRRIMDGGGFAISRVGPKDAMIEYRGMPPCRYAYFREAFRGANHAGIGLFAKSVYVHEVPKRRSDEGMALKCSWV
jgi:serine/threonine protein kinase